MAAPAPVRRPASRPRAVPGPASRQKRRTVASATRHRRRAWWALVPIVALLLGGIVWVNVAKLTVTAETGAVVEQARAVEAETVRLEAALERADAAVVDRAGNRLGMVPSEGDSVIYLTAPSPAR